MRIERGEQTVVGVNRYVDEEESPIQPWKVDPTLESGQRERVVEWRQGREEGEVVRSLEKMVQEARGDGNIMYPMKESLAAGATLGEVSDALRRVFGTYRTL